MSAESILEAKFLTYAKICGLPEPQQQVCGIPGRKFRFDFAWPSQKIAVEIQGATWARGRHTRGAGYRKDCEKLNLATLHGWRVLWLTDDMITTDWMEKIKALLEGKP